MQFRMGMDSFFSNLTMGLFGQTDEGESEEGEETRGIKRREDRRRKRWYGGSSRLSTLGPTDEPDTELEDSRPAKRIRLSAESSGNVFPKEETGDVPKRPSKNGPSLSSLPEDLLSHCLSFLGGVEDRHALQCTCKQFRRISNTDEMLIGIQVGGDKETGLNGIITEKDTPEAASGNLAPFALAGNLEAIYM